MLRIAEIFEVDFDLDIFLGQIVKYQESSWVIIKIFFGSCEGTSKEKIICRLVLQSTNPKEIRQDLEDYDSFYEEDCLTYTYKLGQEHPLKLGDLQRIKINMLVEVTGIMSFVYKGDSISITYTFNLVEPWSLKKIERRYQNRQKGEI